MVYPKEPTTWWRLFFMLATYIHNVCFQSLFSVSYWSSLGGSYLVICSFVSYLRATPLSNMLFLFWALIYDSKRIRSRASNLSMCFVLTHEINTLKALGPCISLRADAGYYDCTIQLLILTAVSFSLLKYLL